MQNGHIKISPLARAILGAVRAGQLTEDSPERQLEDMALVIVRMRVGGIEADFLRVMAALCEVAAEMKEETRRSTDEGIITMAAMGIIDGRGR